MRAKALKLGNKWKKVMTKDNHFENMLQTESNIVATYSNNKDDDGSDKDIAKLLKQVIIKDNQDCSLD